MSEKKTNVQSNNSMNGASKDTNANVNNPTTKNKSEQTDQAEYYKEEGNKAFNQNHFASAVEWYSKAIEQKEDAVYYANRAFCHIKLEEYGSAIEDATKAIEVDTSYIKGYYRRGCAYLGLGKYKQAVNDFKQVTAISPNDKNAKSKLVECQKALFAKAIEGVEPKPPSETLDLKSMEVEKSYNGPHLPNPINVEFIKELIEHYKQQKKLHKKYVYQIVYDAIQLFKKLPTLIEIDIPQGKQFTVCGDIHGQYYDLLNIFKMNGLPSIENPYLFNGDFVDRGSFSIEVIVLFFALKLLYPNHFHMLRGNHESKTMNQIYGFKGEVINKVDTNPNAYELFSEAFCWLPLAAVIGKKVLVVHGGLFSEDGVTLDNIKKIDRFCQPPDKGIMCEIMWSDPQPQKGRAPSKRGVALCFGPDVTHRFLKDNNLDYLIRSHEVKDEGYHVEHDGKCITIFSAPNYCDQMGNKGAYIKLTSDLKMSYTKFEAVPHPDVAPMAYASPLFRM